MPNFKVLSAALLISSCLNSFANAMTPGEDDDQYRRPVLRVRNDITCTLREITEDARFGVRYPELSNPPSVSNRNSFDDSLKKLFGEAFLNNSEQN